MTKIRNAKPLQRKSRTHVVTQVALRPGSGCTLDHFQVCSGSSGNCYDVTFTPHLVTCSCNWGLHRKAGQSSLCSHVISVQNFIAQLDGRKVMAWTSEADAARQHRPTVQVGELYLTTRKAVAD